MCALYPTALTAWSRAAGSTVPSTRAVSVARFTLASVTPGTALSARSTRATQEAQVMPSMLNSCETAGTW